MTLEEKAKFLRDAIVSQFVARTTIQGDKSGKDFGINLDTKEEDRSLWLTFSKGEESHSIDIPLPFTENGIDFLKRSSVRRALCKYFIEERQLTLDFLDTMYYIICSDASGIIPAYMIKKVSFLQQIIYSFDAGNASTIIYNLQRAMGEVITKMPLHNTDMNSWAMNRRLMIIDPEFDGITSPKERLEYQIEKSRRHFDKGWTSMGLSDGTLADRNYILTEDLKKLTPFGINYHNPQRNLYSTLGMRGDEEPLVRSQSMQDLMDGGITRTGWNLFTVFVDVPDVWEDQILVDISHTGKRIEYQRRHQCFGTLLVKKGIVVREGHRLSVASDGQVKIFNDIADRAWIHKITESTVNVGGVPTKAYNVIIRFVRKLKDGVKITNTAANKGVIRLKELGYAKDPRGESYPDRKIDIMVSSKAVQKRMNYSQILEALFNNVNGEKVVILPDSVLAGDVEGRLEEEGFTRDGMWECETCFGNLKAVAGTVFWGVTHDVEDMLWTEHDTIRKNTRDLRTAGLKFSTVEFRALNTRFGEDNPVVNEIMSYAQGTEDLHQLLDILRPKMNVFPKGMPVVDVKDLKPVDQSTGTIVPEHCTKGTVADENFMPNGFILKLPIKYQIAIWRKNYEAEEGMPQSYTPEQIVGLEKFFIIDSIYVPSIPLRRCWRHETGKLGLSEVSALVNNIVVMCHRHSNEPDNPIHITMLYKAVYSYFARVAGRMGTKRGNLSTYGMSVRYPFSVKAVATLSNSLPKNTIEIHSSMAINLKVSNGDIVLVERFPCLGFMSIRPQKVQITNDEKCRYTIRASGNSLGSLSLDFDGDVLFIASLHTPEAKKALLKEWTNPNKSCYSAIQDLNKKAGKPHTREMGLQEYAISSFDPLTEDTHAAIIANATGVKSHTGPVIALAYNIMRVIENSDVKHDQKTNCAIELFLDRVGNSVFKQKHGVKSLHDIVIDAICTCDVETLVKEGFKRGTSTIICDVIREKAAELNVYDLVGYHELAKAGLRSSIINLIVRKRNMVYFASRASLEGCDLLRHLNQPAVDVPSKMLQWVLSGKAGKIRTPLDDLMYEKDMLTLSTPKMRDVAGALMEQIDKIFSGEEAEASKEVPEYTKDTMNLMRKSFNAIRKASRGKRVVNTQHSASNVKRRTTYAARA